MTVIIMIAQFLLGISILVAIHEAGHMFFAKLFGMRVEKFYVGFPPKVISKQIGETEYAIGAIPLGGFVKITGMVDESMDTKGLEADPEPYEFRAKPAWQRLFVMLGGIIFNIILGVFIFTLIVFTQGEEYLPVEQAKYGIVASDLAKEMGLKDGDIILEANGKKLERFSDAVHPDVLLGSGPVRYTVQRNGEMVKVVLPADVLDRMATSNFKQGFIAPAFPFEVGKVMAGFPAAKAGLQAGDRIVAVNEESTELFHQFQAKLQEVKAQDVNLKVVRGGETLTLPASITDDGKLGFEAKSLLQTNTETFSFTASVPKGVAMAYNIIDLNIKGFGKIFSGEVSASNSVQGPVGMMRNLYGGEWDWLNFWRITGLISMALAFFNLLPIPALDGGHVVFLLWEMITRRKPSLKVMEYAQKFGMVVLLSLMAFVVFNDFFKLFF